MQDGQQDEHFEFTQGCDSHRCRQCKHQACLHVNIVGTHEAAHASLRGNGRLGFASREWPARSRSPEGAFAPLGGGNGFASARVRPAVALDRRALHLRASEASAPFPASEAKPAIPGERSEPAFPRRREAERPDRFVLTNYPARLLPSASCRCRTARSRPFSVAIRRSISPVTRAITAADPAPRR